MSLALYLFAIFAYLSTLVVLYRSVFHHFPIAKSWILILSLAGGLAHLVSSLTTMITPQGADLSLFRSGSLIFSLMVILVSLSSVRRNSHSLLLIVLPVAILFILLSLFTQPTKIAALSGGMAAHVLLSILAYGVITIAACNAPPVSLCFRR